MSTCHLTESEFTQINKRSVFYPGLSMTLHLLISSTQTHLTLSNTGTHSLIFLLFFFYSYPPEIGLPTVPFSTVITDFGGAANH